MLAQVLDKATKNKRLAWCAEYEYRTATFWENRAFADAHYFVLPRTRSEAAGKKLGGKVLRKKGEGGDPRFHGRKGTGYKQGWRLGVFGILAKGRLSVAFMDPGRISGERHSMMVRQNYRRWAGDLQGVYHDGERALWSKKAKEAYAAVQVTSLPLPPYSPDFNPIENAWSLLDERLAHTAPAGFETREKLRKRVRNAVDWLNRNYTKSFRKMVRSMPDRIEACLELKGAMTRY